MCDVIKISASDAVVICGVRVSKQFCATCGHPATVLCDWKVPKRNTGTCDRPCCAKHSVQVARGKHLCEEHQPRYQAWKREHPHAIVTRSGELIQQGNLFEPAGEPEHRA